MRLKRIASILLASAMMAVAFAPAALADVVHSDNGIVNPANPDDPANANQVANTLYVKKTLNQADGVTLAANVDFFFEITPVKVGTGDTDGSGNDIGAVNYSATALVTDPAYMPQIGTSINNTSIHTPAGLPAGTFFGTTVTSTAGATDGVAYPTDNDNNVSSLSGADVLASVTGTTFPHAGVYVYSIKEKGSSFTEVNTATLHESISNSQAEYYIRVYVINDTAVPGQTKIKYVTTERITDDAGTASTDGKVTHGSTETTNDFNFTNTHYLTRTFDPLTRTDYPLAITKVVAGDYADQTKLFDFTVDISDASVTQTPTYAPPYTARICTLTGGTYTDVAATVEQPTVTFSFTPGTPVTGIKLKHGQYLVFDRMPAGAHYTVVETDATASYQPSASFVVGGGAPTTVAAGAFGATNYNAYGTNATLVGQTGANTTTVTNTARNITPTGIVINNLPYLLLAMLAIFGIFFFMMAKRRREDMED